MRDANFNDEFLDAIDEVSVKNANTQFSRYPVNPMLGWEDMYQESWVACLTTLNKYDRNKSTPRTYFGNRARGAILDKMREFGTMTRGLVRHFNARDMALEALLSRGIRDPSDSEIASEMGLEESDIRKWDRARLALADRISLDGIEEVFGFFGEPTEPIQDSSRYDEVKQVIKSLDCLSYVEQQSVSMTLLDGLKQFEIADHLGISAQRVNQIIQRAIQKLRIKLKVR